MGNYFQCPTCGSPNDSKSKCAYCGNVFSSNEILSPSITDKELFDLAIYEVKKENYEKALKYFEKQIQQDSKNRFAWLYKFLCEFGIEWNFDELINNLTSYKMTDFVHFVNDELLKIFQDIYGNVRFSMTDSNINIFKYFKRLPESLHSGVLSLYIERFNFGEGLNLGNEENKIRILNEIEAFVNLLSGVEIERELIKKYYDNLTSFSQKFLNEELAAIKKKEEWNFKYSQKQVEPLRQNDLFKEYLKNDYCGKLISIFQLFGEFSLKIGIDIDKQIERLKIIDSDINQATKPVSKSVTDKSTPCFIATATMGSYDHPVVMDLRLFRDNWLLKRNWGIAFTKWYYTHGPQAARVIEKSIVLKKISFWIIVKPLHVLIKKITND